MWDTRLKKKISRCCLTLSHIKHGYFCLSCVSMLHMLTYSKVSILATAVLPNKTQQTRRLTHSSWITCRNPRQQNHLLLQAGEITIQLCRHQSKLIFPFSWISQSLLAQLAFRDLASFCKHSHFFFNNMWTRSRCLVDVKRRLGCVRDTEISRSNFVFIDLFVFEMQGACVDLLAQPYFIFHR